MSRVVVLGLGNGLMRDEGVGARAAERLRLVAPPEVEVIEAPTLGPATLPEVEGATHLLILDAVDAGRQPGTIIEVEPSALGSRGASLSAHDFVVADLLVMLEHVGRSPERSLVLGVQPAVVGPGAELSPAVERALPGLVRTALSVLAAWC